jgi:hypothetical protein
MALILGSLRSLREAIAPPVPQEAGADQADRDDHGSAKKRRRAVAEMLECIPVIDRADRLAEEEKAGMHRHRSGARGLAQIGDVNLNAIVQHVKADAEQQEHRRERVPRQRSE